MLKTINLHKKYNDFTALQSLNLEVGKGEIYALLGQNGAGKSTTINILLGLIKATSGDALINNISVNDHPQQIKKELAYIPETVLLYPNLTGIENLDFFSKIAGFNYSKEELSAFLMQTGLQEIAHQKALGGYSKGMRQKVGIAIALAKDAKVLLLDEPTSGLDPIATAEFTEIVRQLGQEGRTVLMATHDIFNAVSVASNIGIMKQGQLVQNLQSKAFTAEELQELYLKTI
ncbi:ABC transporter ATP-binding protein [Chryseobacterium sp. G0186]|uniref:ABC transporter ATP-binding protein n=1 Tax=Chryseobacterium sp. G0186 TaxID=2487064 RepID=UPI000F4F5559|nr:ABC transporter ATP-binding protein [Chryseobacterium sp. G0186]AZA76227.1 ABC transporter ATP-binding protein [Chryseobacterium sp. G0186]